jgi:hypothetical protein
MCERGTKCEHASANVAMAVMSNVTSAKGFADVVQRLGSEMMRIKCYCGQVTWLRDDAHDCS